MLQSRISKKENTWNNLMFWFSYFMSFPAILIFGFNITLFIFFFIFNFIITNAPNYLSISKYLQWVAIFFLIGCILSVILLPRDSPPGSLSRTLQVLPNYIYWPLLIIILISLRQQLNFKIIYKGIFWGIISSIIYYFFIQNTIIGSIPIFNSYSPNSFSFLIICYTPIFIYYALRYYGKLIGYSLGIFVVLAGFLSGSRSASILVFAGVLIVLFLNTIRLRYVFITVIFFYLIFPLLLSLRVVENTIYSLNTRTGDLLYNYNEVITEDRSYLTRVAMVRKGLFLFEEHPLSGAGLNNFTHIDVDIEDDFVGSEYVVNKSSINDKSAHNSYIQLLAEGGLLVFIPFVLIVSGCLIYFIRNIADVSSYEKPFFIGLILMAMHLYVISAIVNVFAWYLLGLCSALVYRNRLSPKITN